MKWHIVASKTQRNPKDKEHLLCSTIALPGVAGVPRAHTLG